VPAAYVLIGSSHGREEAAAENLAELEVHRA
jgi:hypothetical protein